MSDDQIFRITPRGVIAASLLHMDGCVVIANDVADALIAHMSKFYGPTPGIVLVDNQLRFVTFSTKEEE